MALAEIIERVSLSGTQKPYKKINHIGLIRLLLVAEKYHQIPGSKLVAK